MIELSKDNYRIGATYSESNYSEYKENNNIFEEVIDSLMLDQYSDDTELTDFIKSLPKADKRMAILSLLDSDNNMWLKLKSLIGGENLSKVEQIKDVVLMLREYVKIAEVEKKKFGEVMTPLELVKEMLATLPKEVWSNPDLKWLDPANGTGPFPCWVIFKLMKGLESWEPNEELRYKHIIENMIYVCELQPKNMFLYLCAIDPKDEYDCNIYTGSFLDDSFDKHMKEIWNVDKFDIVIGNPPYNQMIDMLFITKSYNISDSILFVHPSTWLLDEKGIQKKFNSTKNLIGEHLESIQLFNGNKLFNIALFVPCVISYVNKNKEYKGIKCIDKINNTELLYNNIFEVNKFSDIEIYPSIKSKILSKKSESVWSYYKDKSKNNTKDFMVSFTGIRGNVNLKSDESMIQNDFYTIVSSDRKVQESNTIVGDSFLKFYFNTKFEAENFLKFLKTNISRFLISIYKNNQNLHRGELDILPWLDFSREWTDEDLIQEFDLTNEEVEFINKHIPKYY